MKIQYCSDLHLEFAQNNIFLEKNPIVPKGEILILAGDIVPLHEIFFKNSFFDYVSDNFKQVYWLPGNHEFYQRDIADFANNYNIEIRKNVALVNNIAIAYKEVNFIFSTLWSKISLQNEKIIENSVSDFEIIFNKGKKITTSDFNKFHEVCLDFIESSFLKKSDKTIVVTHHVPSKKCNSDEHNKSKINEAFCVDLTEFIKKCNADFWIYGHSHYNQKLLKIGNTFLLTNQLGYVHLNEQKGYVDDAVFEI
ncbi:MAG: metallophosphoesterase [Bacteroidales bacterium]|jgi:Icc-related predicted phosphoesterase